MQNGFSKALISPEVKNILIGKLVCGLTGKKNVAAGYKIY